MKKRQSDTNKSTSSLGSSKRQIKVVRRIDGSSSPSTPHVKASLPNSFTLRRSYESRGSLDSTEVNPCLDSMNNPLQQTSVNSAALPPKLAKFQSQQPPVKLPSLQHLESVIRKSKLMQ